MIEVCAEASCPVCRPQPARSREARIGTSPVHVNAALRLVRVSRRALMLAALVLDAADSALEPFDAAAEGC